MVTYCLSMARNGQGLVLDYFTFFQFFGSYLEIAGKINYLEQNLTIFDNKGNCMAIFRIPWKIVWMLNVIVSVVFFKELALK